MSPCTHGTIRIGPYELPSVAVLAPMAGVTDRPFRILCRKLGAGLAASEMLTSDTRLWSTPKSRLRMGHEGEPEPRVVQLAGADPEALAEAARINVDLGAQIIDLNMGCPAKKVCGKLCGSALLQDEPLVARILEAVVRAVTVPVTLKIRTGWDREHRNGVRIARIAEAAGVQALAVHGRTRADFYAGRCRVRDDPRRSNPRCGFRCLRTEISAQPQKAREVLDFTGADGVMLGRASHGAPWIFRAVNAYLRLRELPLPRSRAPRCVILFSRISTPCTPSTARTPESGSRANISAGIANSCCNCGDRPPQL